MEKTTEETAKEVFEIFKASLKQNELSQWERYSHQFLSFAIKENSFVIFVEDDLYVDWFTPLYSAPLANVLNSMDDTKTWNVKFEKSNNIPEKNKDRKDSRKDNPPPAANIEKTEDSRKRQPKKTNISTLALDEKYTFENFVRGPSNSFAYATATAVAKNPGKSDYNPLFIYGQTGLGKTHLMQAIGNYVIQHFPGLKVCYLTSETFLNEYVNAIQNERVKEFREKYRQLDLLLLDDVQFIADKAKIQEEFFNTFNILQMSQKQVVMTSDVKPSDLEGLEPRLISRFEGGMTTEIESPGFETRLAILRKKMSNVKTIIPKGILEFIAENITTHVRALEGALRKIIAFTEISPDIPLDVNITKQILKDSIESEKIMKDLTIDEIQQSVAKSFGMDVKEILKETRTQSVVTARQIAMLLSRKLTSKSLMEIGDKFKRTHPTIVHGMQTIINRIASEPALKGKISEIVFSLGRKPGDVFD